MSEPIPKNLLVHSISVESYVSMVSGAETFGTAYTINNVRVEPAFQNRYTGVGDSTRDQFIVVIDTVNSSSSGAAIKKKDRITFGSLVLRVRKNIPAYGDTSAVHHYEVTCE